MPQTKSKSTLQITQDTKQKLVSDVRTEKSWAAKAVRNKFIIIPLGILAIAGVLYYFRSLFVVVIVNGQPIDRITFTKELEKAAGSQILNQLVTKTLILQEAKKQNVTVGEDQVDAELKKIEDQLAAQGQKLDEALSAQRLTRKDLAEQIRVQKLVEKMLSKETEVTDKEVEDFLAQNPDATKQSGGSEEDKKRIKEQLRQQKFQQKFQSWLSELQQKAKILYFVNPK